MEEYGASSLGRKGSKALGSKYRMGEGLYWGEFDPPDGRYVVCIELIRPARS